MTRRQQRSRQNPLREDDARSSTVATVDEMALAVEESTMELERKLGVRIFLSHLTFSLPLALSQYKDTIHQSM
jgi:hypothetical protein